MSTQFILNDSIEQPIKNKIQDILIYLIDNTPLTKIKDLLIYKSDDTRYFLSLDKDREKSKFDSLCFNIYLTKYVDTVTDTDKGIVKHTIPTYINGELIYEPI